MHQCERNSRDSGLRPRGWWFRHRIPRAFPSKQFIPNIAARSLPQKQCVRRRPQQCSWRNLPSCSGLRMLGDNFGDNFGRVRWKCCSFDVIRCFSKDNRVILEIPKTSITKMTQPSSMFASRVVLIIARKFGFIGLPQRSHGVPIRAMRCLAYFSRIGPSKVDCMRRTDAAIFFLPYRVVPPAAMALFSLTSCDSLCSWSFLALAFSSPAILKFNAYHSRHHRRITIPEA